MLQTNGRQERRIHTYIPISLKERVRRLLPHGKTISDFVTRAVLKEVERHERRSQAQQQNSRTS